MGAITYTALREFQPVSPPFAKVGQDISAAPADDSFNASTTVISGLLVDEWVKVSGFANAANNGFFQLKSNSTSAKIIELTPPPSHLRLPGVAGNSASTPSSAANRIIGDITMIAKIAITDYSGVNNELASKRLATPGGDSYAWVELNTGIMRFNYSVDGTTTIPRDSTVTLQSVGIVDGQTILVAVTVDVDDGAGNHVVKHWYSINDGVTWLQLGATVTTAGTISLFDTVTVPLFVGSRSDNITNPTQGRIFWLKVCSGNSLASAVAAYFNPSRAVRGASTFVASTGETWTLNQSGTPPAEWQGAALVTEAAGPTVTITGYKRGLGQSYNLEFYSERVDRSVQVKRSLQQPLGGGAPEVLTFRRETYVDLVVLGPLGALLTETQMLQWREFLASVEGGETFTFDRYGTIAAPVEAKTAMLASDDYTEERIAGAGNAGLYKLSIRVRLLS